MKLGSLDLADVATARALNSPKFSKPSLLYVVLATIASDVIPASVARAAPGSIKGKCCLNGVRIDRIYQRSEVWKCRINRTFSVSLAIAL